MNYYWIEIKRLDDGFSKGDIAISEEENPLEILKQYAQKCNIQLNKSVEAYPPYLQMADGIGLMTEEKQVVRIFLYIKKIKPVRIEVS